MYSLAISPALPTPATLTALPAQAAAAVPTQTAIDAAVRNQTRLALSAVLIF